MPERTDRDPQPTGCEDLPSHTFSPPAGVVIGALVAGVIFAIVLEFLVIISFIGQRLWTDDAIGRDIVFTMPLLLWVGVVLTVIVLLLRTLTAWLQINAEGFRLQGLARGTIAHRWDEVGKVVAIHDIDRGTTPAEMLDAPETAYDGVYVLSPSGERMLAVSSRFFGHRAQDAAMTAARAAGVTVEEIDAISPADLKARLPQALGVGDRHPNLMLAGVALFYVFHNVFTFIVWGL